jgi:hypothetical protein
MDPLEVLAKHRRLERKHRRLEKELADLKAAGGKSARTRPPPPPAFFSPPPKPRVALACYRKAHGAGGSMGRHCMTPGALGGYPSTMGT